MPSWFDENRHLYPDDWDEIAARVKEAAGRQCEACDEPHGDPPHVLTVDHVVDHDPSNCAPENLAALCQRCHLRRHNMVPKPATKEEALRRLRRRAELERTQLRLLDEPHEEPVQQFPLVIRKGTANALPAPLMIIGHGERQDILAEELLAGQAPFLCAERGLEVRGG